MHLAVVAMSGFKLLHIVTTGHQHVLQEFNEITHMHIPPTLHLSESLLRTWETKKNVLNGEF